MAIGVLLTLAVSGLAVGFLSGLVGIGGGVLIVPLLYFFYAHAGWSGVAVPVDLQAVVAHATSLFVIIPTSALGTWTYHRVGLVDWRAALPVAGGSVLAAVAGSLVAPLLPGPALKLAFGLLLLVMGVRMFRGRSSTPRPARRTHPGMAALAGAGIGLLSALLGVGGGIVAIPILIHFFGLGLDRVAATSMAIIVFTAAAGVAGYVAGGLGEPGVPSGSLGYVHLLAGLPILVGSMVAVRAGTRANQRMSTRGLRILFGVLLLVMGVRLVIQNLSVLPWPA